VELQERLRRDVNQVNVLQEGEMVHSGKAVQSSKARDGLRHGDKSAKGPGERG